MSKWRVVRRKLGHDLEGRRVSGRVFPVLGVTFRIIWQLTGQMKCPELGKLERIDVTGAGSFATKCWTVKSFLFPVDFLPNPFTLGWRRRAPSGKNDETLVSQLAQWAQQRRPEDQRVGTATRRLQAPTTNAVFRALFVAQSLSAVRIKVVHNGVMRTEAKTVRQSVSLPAKIATQVRSMAKSRRLSATRMLVELIENGIEAEQRKQQAFFDLAERFRRETDPEVAKRLGDELGQMVFGG